MTPIEVLVKSQQPGGSREYFQLMYGQDIWGGKITRGVKIIGDVYIPQTSWVSGKCQLRDVKLPYNTSIISMSLHEGQQLGKVGDFKLVKDFRLSRGVYVSGLIREEDHRSMNCRTIIGYELSVYGRNHVSKKVYKEIQKKKTPLGDTIYYY